MTFRRNPFRRGQVPYRPRNAMTQATTLPPLQAPPLWKAYLAILAPMMLTNTLQAAAGTIDGIYLGQMIGLDAIAAVSAFFPVFFFCWPSSSA